jgi:ribosomal protein S1
MQAKRKLEDLKVDEEVEGTVSRVATIGIWIDIGAEKDALLPKLMTPPGSNYQSGDKINVKITEVLTGSTPAERKIRVSIKDVDVQFKVGDIKEGTVSSSTKFGIFVNLDGPDCLVPLRELDKPIGEYKNGDKVQVKVIKIEGARITCSTKLKDDAIKIEDLTPGQSVTGKVLSVSPNIGLFLDIGANVDALYRANQLEKPVSEYKAGDTISGLNVISVDVNKEQVEVSTRPAASSASEGQVLEGTAESITKFGVFFDVGFASSVLCPIRFLAKPLDEYTQGEVADLTVIAVEGERVTVSCGELKTLSTLTLGMPVTGTVVRAMPGLGLLIDIGASTDALFRNPPNDVKEYKSGDKFDDLFITKIDTERNQVEVSSLSAAEKGGAKAEVSDFKVGQEVEGTVSRVMDFGVFVDVGGTRDALYPSDQLDQPKETYKPGDKITVKIVEADAQKDRLTVSNRKVAGDFSVGDKVEATVAKVMAFGIFCDIGAATQALAPAALLEKEPDEYSVGEKISMTVSRVDAEAGKISVAEKEGAADTGGGSQASQMKVGQKIDGKVKGVQSYGAFIDIGLGRTDALLPGALVKEGVALETLEVGDSIEVWVSNVDMAKNRITVSMTEVKEEAATYSPTGKVPYGYWVPPKEWLLQVRYKGKEYMTEPEGYEIDWHEWEKKYPEIVKFPETEAFESVIFESDGINFKSFEESKQGKMFHMPVPLGLRKDDAGSPEIPRQGYDPDYYWHTWESGMKKEISIKYRTPPLNDPNWQYRPNPGETSAYKWAWEQDVFWKGRAAKGLPVRWGYDNKS